MSRVHFGWLMAFSTLVLAFNVSAASYTWTGAQSTIWSEPLNWSPNGIPSAGDSAFLSGATAYLPSTASLTTLIISNSTVSGATLTVANVTASGTNTISASLALGNFKVLDGQTTLNSGNTNDGNFSVNSGILKFNALFTFSSLSSISGSGTVVFASLATINGSYSVSGETDINSTVTFNSNATFGTLVIASSMRVQGTGSLTVVNSVNTPGTGQTIQGVTLNNQGTFNIPIGAPASLILDGCSLNNTGTILWAGAAVVEGRNGAVINNFSLFNLNSTGTISYAGVGSAPTLNNSGSFIKNTSTGNAAIDYTLNNTGTIISNSGDLVIRSGVDTGSLSTGVLGTLSITGTLALNAGSSIGGTGIFDHRGNLVVNTPVSVNTTFNNQGILSGVSTLTVTGVMNCKSSARFFGSGTTLTNSLTVNVKGNLNVVGSVQLQNSTLINSGSGLWAMGGVAGLAHANGSVFKNAAGATLSVSGSNLLYTGATSTFSNSGTLILSASSASTLTLPNLIESSTGEIDIDIGGKIAGTQFDLLTISGAASLDGALRVTLINSFVPSPTDTFKFMTFASGIGTFSSVVNTNSSLVPQYASTSVQLGSGAAPIAKDDSYSVNEGGVLVIPTNGVLANDTDANGGTLTAKLVTPATHGIVTLNSDGSFIYSPNVNFFGTDTFTYVAHDSLDSSPATVSIIVDFVNQAPSFTSGPDPIALENGGPVSLPNWATDITAGPPSEIGQNLTFNLSTDNDPLFAVKPAISSDGTLSFIPAPNSFGMATVTVLLMDDGGTANGGIDQSIPQTFTIAVDHVNQAPSFTAGADPIVLENGGLQSITNWATNITAGPPNETGQTLTFDLTNTNNLLFAVQPSLASDGTLTFTPADDEFGEAIVTVTLKDDGGTANGGSDHSPSQTFTITIENVNHAPSFTAGTDQFVLENAGLQSIANWATNVSAGPPNEATQVLTFEITNTNPSLFSVQPYVAPDGTLTYLPAADQFGTAAVTVSLMDDGGVSNGGVDHSPPQTFLISVGFVNHAPSFIAGPDIAVLENSGPQFITGWATNISAGPSSENGQSLTFNVSTDNDALFAAVPLITSDGTLAFIPAHNAFGLATVTVSLLDNGGVENGGSNQSAPQTFTISVNNVNQAPSFTKGPDVQVALDSAPYTSQNWATNISAGPLNEAGQGLIFEETNDNNALFAVQPFISADGTLTFTVAPGQTGTATVSVTLFDDGGTANGGQDQSLPQTFTITISAPGKPVFSGAGIPKPIIVIQKDPSGTPVSFEMPTAHDSVDPSIRLPVSVDPAGDINSGIYTGVFQLGTTTVTFTAIEGGQIVTGQTTITVVLLSITGPDLVAVAASTTLTVTGAPAGVTFTWSPDNSVVAALSTRSLSPTPGKLNLVPSADTLSAEVTGLAAGPVAITATASFGGSVSTTLIVYTITMDPPNVSVNVNDTATVTATVVPDSILSRVRFSVINGIGQASVDKLTPTASPDVLTITGVIQGDAALTASVLINGAYVSVSSIPIQINVPLVTLSLPQQFLLIDDGRGFEAVQNAPETWNP